MLVVEALTAISCLCLFRYHFMWSLFGTSNKNAFIALLKQKVLLIDDSELICKRISAMVSELSFVEVVGQATDGAQAQEKILHFKPDVVLLDINIPGSSGYDILIWLRKSSQDTTVIMISNHSQKEYRDKAFSLGANYFLDKSSEFEKLPHLLSTICLV